MRFYHPWLLLLLLLVPLFVWLRHRNSSRNRFPFSSASALKRLPVAWTIYVSRSLPFIFGFGLVFLIVAMARPQRGLTEHSVKSEGIDIVMLVDLSRSMDAMDLSTAIKRRDRLDASKEVMEPFIKERINDRIAMVGFSAVPYSVAPLTLDHGWLIQRMEMLKTGMLEDGTAIGSAIASGSNRLRDSKAKSRIMVLLTDGVNNRGKLSPEDAARAAEALGIKIYTVGVGSNEGWINNPGGGIFARQRMRVELDEKGLQNIAEITGGLYFRATDMNELKKIYAKIDEMEKTEIEMKDYTRYEEAFMPFVFWGAGLLLIEKLLAFSRFGRLP